MATSNPETARYDKGAAHAIIRYLALVMYGFARYLPNHPMQFGRRIRRWTCRRIFRRCGENVNIERGAYFGTGRNIEIGDNSGIGRNAYIAGVGLKGTLLMGNDVMMGPEVAILTMSHNYKNMSIPMRCQGDIGETVMIHDDVWIGIRAIILPGARIQKGAIIGAGAVVSGSVAEFTIAGGVPAVEIDRRHT